VEIEKIDTEITEAFKINLLDVQQMVKEYQTLSLIPGDTQSYRICRTALTSCVHTRTGINKRRLELNSEDQKRIKDRNEAAKQLATLIAPAEEYLIKLVRVEDARKTAIREKKERIERDRVRGIREKISGIQRLADGVNALQREHIEEVMADIDAMAIETEEFQEFVGEAEEVLIAVRKVVQAALETRIKLDREAEERRIEAERFLKIRVEQEAQAKELAEAEAKRKIEEAAIVAERQVIEEEKARIESERIAEIQRKEREKREKEIAEAAKVQAEKDAAAKAEREEAERVAKEKTEAERVAREEALKPDKEKMADYANRLESDWPDLKNPEAQDFLAEIGIKISRIATELREWTGEENNAYNDI